MQAVVKTPKTEIIIKGNISVKVLSVLMEEYGSAFNIVENEDDGECNLFEIEGFKSGKEKTLPGDSLRIYRESKGLTQAELGEELGGIPRQHISNMERGQRSISINTARKLSEIFNISVEKFIL
jgi:DNA-binding XRE family transcriptional regulator